MVFLALESAFFALTVYKSDREDLGKMANLTGSDVHLSVELIWKITQQLYTTWWLWDVMPICHLFLHSLLSSLKHMESHAFANYFFSSYFLLLLCSWNEMDKYFPWAFLVFVFYGHLHFVIVMSTSQYVMKVWRHYKNIGFSSNFLAFAFSNSFAKLKSLHTMISVLIFYYLLLTNQLPYPKQQWILFAHRYLHVERTICQKFTLNGVQKWIEHKMWTRMQW